MRTIELTGILSCCGMSAVLPKNPAAPFSRGIANQCGVMKSASKDSDLDHSGCSWVVLCAGWIFKGCGTLGDSMGDPALTLGLPGGIEIRDRGN